MDRLDYHDDTTPLTLIRPAFDIGRYQKPKKGRVPTKKEQALANEFWTYMKVYIDEFNRDVIAKPELKLREFTYPGLLEMIRRKGWQFCQEEFIKVQKSDNVTNPFRLFLWKYKQVKVPTKPL